MKLGRAGLVTAVCWSVVATVFASCTDEKASSSGDSGLTTGVPGAVGAATGAGSGGSSGDPRIDYCKEITKSCIEDTELAKHNQMYTTESNCRDIAMLIPEGDTGDTVGNTIECRRHFLQFAGDDPDLNCKPAGPASWDGKCGQSCDNFCSLAGKICTGDQAQFASDKECATACAKWSQTQPYFVTDNGGPEGDNYACRLYQLIRGHCGDIGVDSEACADPEPPDAGMDAEQDADDASDGAGGGSMDAGDPDAADSGG